MGRLQIALILAALAFLLHVPLLGTPPLAGTEAHRAVTAHQMVQRGDPWVPMLYGRLYLRKPPLHYQVLAATESLTGHAKPWVWRLPSVLWGALTTAVVAWAACGWWGPRAGWAAGLLQTGMVALWAQTRSCEIDALNTLLATIAAIAAAYCVLPETRRRLAASLWMAGSLFLLLAAKGPAGLPAVLGVTVAALVVVPGAWKRVALWLGWTLGAVLAAGAAAMLYVELRRRGLPLDLSGVQEGMDNLYDTRASRYVQALLLPVQLIAFALPASLGLAWGLVRWHRLDLTLKLLLASVLASWAVCVVSGMVNPRYAYVTFPLAALAAGGVIAQLGAAVPAVKWRKAAIASGIAMALLSFPMAIFTLHNKQSRSGRAAALELRGHLDRLPSQPREILVAQALRYQPELMFYADLPARSPGERLPPADQLPPGTHLLVTDEELARLAEARPETLATVVSNERRLHLIVLHGP